MATVLVTGGTGLVGKYLCKRLERAGFDVAILSQVRYNIQDYPVFYWNWQTGKVDETALKNSDYIIHLAGANIAGKRWTKDRKKLIVNSRVQSAQFLHRKLKELNIGPKAFISSSAVGYYGALTSSKVFYENDLSGNDFLARTCQLWETASSNVYDPRIRTVQLRTGMVLTPKGGALQKMLRPIKMGIGSIPGKGNQFIPWIHIDDLCELFVMAINDDSMVGAYNAVAPEYHTFKTFIDVLANKVGQRIWLPNIPELLVKLMVGEMSCMLLFGSKISSARVLELGFRFSYPRLKDALDNLLK